MIPFLDLKKINANYSQQIKGEIRSLTSFRFLTAFVVFLFHCYIHLDFRFDIKLVDKFIKNGAVFMTGFFVLSGYIMAYVYQGKDFTKLEEVFVFYKKRFAKIYPVYFVGTIAFFLFIKPAEPYTISQWGGVIVNDLFLTQSLFSKMFSFGMNGGTWSVSVEVFLYLVFPFLMLFRNCHIGLLFFGSLLLLVVNANVLFGIVPAGSVDVYSNPVMRIPDFIIGIVFFILGNENKLNNLPKVLKSGIFLFLVIFTLTAVSQSKMSYQFMGMQFFITMFFGLFIFSLHHSKSIVMQNSITNFLGKISYSFYIWQFVAIEFGRFLKKDFGISSFSLVLMVLFLNIIISIASYYIIEEPSRKFLISKLITT